MFCFSVSFCGVNDATGGFHLLLQSPFTYCLQQPHLRFTKAHPVPKFSRPNLLSLFPSPHRLPNPNLKQSRPLPDFSAIRNVQFSDIA